MSGTLRSDYGNCGIRGFNNYYRNLNMINFFLFRQPYGIEYFIKKQFNDFQKHSSPPGQHATTHPSTRRSIKEWSPWLWIRSTDTISHTAFLVWPSRAWVFWNCCSPHLGSCDQVTITSASCHNSCGFWAPWWKREH